MTSAITPKIPPITDAMIEDFVAVVWDCYNRHSRDNLPWRQPEANGNFDPYKIMVSEIMLQQTQVNRVISKYNDFLQAFPTIEILAQASQAKVMRHWSGLGYNRRARFLLQAAQQIINTQHVTCLQAFPVEITELVKLSGIGKNTAAAIRAYAFNKPAVFIETNIRTVFIHHFFVDQENIADSAILELVKATVPENNVRNWYWALMDYGAYLKSQKVNNISRSRHYVRQSSFAGSKRQIRGAIVRYLTAGSRTFEQLEQQIDDIRLQVVLKELLDEQLIVKTTDGYGL